MALHEVDKYQAFWNIGQNHGRICVWKDGAEDTWTFEVDSPQEFTALIDILRNEKPVSYDPDEGMIGIGCEVVGEGEVSAAA